MANNEIEEMKRELISEGRAVRQVIKIWLDQALAKPYKSLTDGFMSKEESMLVSKLVALQVEVTQLKEENSKLKDQMYDDQRERKTKYNHSLVEALPKDLEFQMSTAPILGDLEKKI